MSALRNEAHDLWYTGLPPERCPGFSDGKLHGLPLLDLERADAEAAQAYFDNAWTLTEVLFSGLVTHDAFYTPAYHRLRHPMIFYFGHAASFYVNKLRVAGLLSEPVNPHFESIFEVGVDEMSWDLDTTIDREWPTIDEVVRYRAQVYRTIREAIPRAFEAGTPRDMQSVAWALAMGIEHERIHIETSSVLVRELPVSEVMAPAAWPDDAPVAATAHTPHNVHIPSGRVGVGKPDVWPTYGWDNEYGHDTRRYGTFDAKATLTTNAEMLAFVRGGGYREARFWSDEGWRWRRYRNTKWPTFWVPAGPEGLHEYQLRTLFHVIDLPGDWPAIVNRYEAEAYACWYSEMVGRRWSLPTEAEHLALRPRAARPSPEATDSASQALGDITSNLHLKWGSERSVWDDAPTPAGVYDAMGNVWQWQADDFHPLPGGDVHPFYDDFSAPCYDGEHFMILGGSFASTGDLASIFARYHFRPHFFQHAGFRLVHRPDGGDGAPVRVNAEPKAYEDDQAISAYLTLHYGDVTDQLPSAFDRDLADYPRRIAEKLVELAPSGGRALDLGCAVGRSTFELARHFDEVIGVDMSVRFIEIARRLQSGDSLHYRRLDEGDRGVWREAFIDDEIDADRVGFANADATLLPEDFSGFDAVLMSNLVDRVPSPRQLLAQFTERDALVRPGGVVLIASPYTWLEAYSERSEWLSNEHHDARSALLQIMGQRYDLVHESETPLVIRETQRKFQYILTHVMAWTKR